MNLWEHEEPVSNYEIDVPRWIDQDITPNQIAAICQGGCISGAYMPAVRYSTAATTMAEHGDDVLQYLEDHLGELPTIPNDIGWSQIAVLFLSQAVDCWAGAVHDDLEKALELAEEEAEEALEDDSE